jgi:hypothetical protein
LRPANLPWSKTTTLLGFKNFTIAGYVCGSRAKKERKSE